MAGKLCAQWISKATPLEPSVHKVTHPHSAGERDRIIGFLDGQLRKEAGFSVREEYPAIFGEFPGGESVFIERAGRIASHVGFVVRDYHHPEFRLKIGLLGSVATAPEWQNQGLASHLLQAAVTELKARGCALAVLWSDAPDFYKALGFERGGRERDFKFSTQATLEGSQTTVPFDSLLHGHWVWRLYLKHAGRLDRSLEEQKRLFKIPKAQIFVTEKQGEVSSYLAIHKGADFTNYIHEWGGDLLSVRDNIASTQRQFFADKPLTLIAPAYYDLAPLRSIASEEWPGILGLVKILDRGAVLSTYLNYLKRHGHTGQWQREVGKVTIDGQAVSIAQDVDLVKLVLGNEESPLHPVLPFFLWGFDSI